MSKTIEVSDETYEKFKDQLNEDEITDISSYDDLVGKKWYFRCVTYHQVGEAVKLVGDFIQLKNASWVANSARFMDTVKKGNLDEVEPVGEFYINLKTVVDFFPWKHPLPKDQM